MFFFQATIDFNGFSMVLTTLDHHHWMFFEGPTIGINGFSDGFQNFEGNGQRWFGCPIEPKKCLKSIYDKTQILCRPRISRSIESFWYGPYLLTPYIISQCENHTIQERKCLPTFILAIIVNFNGFEETIADFQWFLRRPSPLNVFWLSDHCDQWFFNGFWFFYHRFQWFSMVPDHWSNDAMVSMDRHGLPMIIR